MGFGDILGDTFDAFRDVGEQSLGVVVDYSKAAYGMSQGDSPWATSRRFNSSFSKRRQRFLSEHETLAALANGAKQIAAGGLYVLGLPAHAQMRTLSATALYTGLPGNPVGDRNLPSWRQAWKASEKVSLGQAVMMNTPGNNPKGINYKNAYRYGTKGDALYNPEFSYQSGTFDAIMAFTDPLIFAGKASKALKVSRETIKPKDLDALATASRGETRRARRVQDDHDSILDATDGTDSYSNYTLFKNKGVNNAAGLASVLAQARDDRATRSLILRHSMGDKDATAALATQRQDIIDQINRMNEDLDDLIYPEFGTKGHDGLFDAEYWDNPLAREELLRQRDESEQILDVYNRTLGDDEKMVRSALPTRDEIGLGLSVTKRVKASKRDLRNMRATSAYYVQPGVGGILTRVVKSPKNMQPSGYVDFHDAEQGVREVEAYLRRVPALGAERRNAMMQRYIDAPDDNARRLVLEHTDEEVFTHLGQTYGYDPEDIADLWSRFSGERRTAWSKAQQAKGDRIFGFDSKGVAEVRPLGEAQLDNGAYTMPIDYMKRELRKNSGRYRALKNVAGSTWSIGDNMADWVNDLWKFQALFRGGYPIRNATDAQLRMLAFLGAHSYLGIQKENLVTAVRNDIQTTKNFSAGADPNFAKPLLGEGTRDIGPYKGLADAMGMNADQAGAYYDSISGVENISRFIGGKYASFLDDLRGTGRWVSKEGHEAGYNDDLIRVVNNQFRNSAITQRLMKGESPESIVHWLKSGEGRALRRRMLYGSDTAEDLVQRNIENLNHVLPQEYWSRFAERPMVADDITEMWGDNLAARPTINAEQIAVQMGIGNFADLYTRVTKAYFEAVSKLTDDAMGRHPLYVQLYRGHQIELVKRMDPKMKGHLDLADQVRIEQQSRIWARREMKSILFDVANKSDLAHFVRFVMPFYSAWSDAITKYGRLMVRDPSRLAYLHQLWTAPNDASFMEVTDANGEIVPAEKSRLSDDEGVVIPQSWAKALGIPFQPKISKSSFNIALQGDPFWLPGWGPLGTTPVNEMIRKTENPTLASAAENLGVLPFGVQDWGKFGWKGFLAGGLRQQGLSDGRRQRLLAQVMQTAYFEAARDGKPEPKWSEIKDKYQSLLDLRTLTSALSPVSVQWQSPYQFYIDQSHAYDRMVGTKFKDFAEADRAFLRDFGEDYYIFRMSMSKTNVAIAPSVRADNAARRVKDLIDNNPKYAALFIGPDNTGEYNRNIYTLQQGRHVGLTSDTWRDTYSDPREAIRLNRVEQGWIEYQKMSARINAVMESRGLTSLNQNAASDLRQIKHDWIERVAGEGGPQWGEAWYDDYQNFGSSAVTGFLGAAKQAVKDDRINTRPDIQALGTYLMARSKIRQILQSRYKAGGSAAITSQSNGDLAAIWDELNTRLRADNVFFEDYWSRYLERDDLTKVVR